MDAKFSGYDWSSFRNGGNYKKNVYLLLGWNLILFLFFPEMPNSVCFVVNGELFPIPGYFSKYTEFLILMLFLNFPFDS